MPVFFILSQTFGKLSAQNGIAIQFLLPNHAPTISVSAGDRPLCRPAQHLAPKTYDKETSRGRGIERAGCGLEQVVPQFVVELGPGGAGFVPGTLAARLAEPLSQRRRRFARSLGIRTARAPAGRRFRAPRRAVLRNFESYLAEQNHLGPQNAPQLLQNPGRLFFRRVRFSRVAADFRRRPRHPRRRPRQIRQRPRPRLCRRQFVLPRRLFPAGH